MQRANERVNQLAVWQGDEERDDSRFVDRRGETKPRVAAVRGDWKRQTAQRNCEQQQQRGEMESFDGARLAAKECFRGC